jgi:hypothetical protein
MQGADEDDADALERKLARGAVINRAVAGVLLLCAGLYMILQGLFWGSHIVRGSGQHPISFIGGAFAFAVVAFVLGARVLRQGWPGGKERPSPVPLTMALTAAVPSLIVTALVAWLMFG